MYAEGGYQGLAQRPKTPLRRRQPGSHCRQLQKLGRWVTQFRERKALQAGERRQFWAQQQIPPLLSSYPGLHPRHAPVDWSTPSHKGSASAHTPSWLRYWLLVQGRAAMHPPRKRVSPQVQVRQFPELSQVSQQGLTCWQVRVTALKQQRSSHTSLGEQHFPADLSRRKVGSLQERQLPVKGSKLLHRGSTRKQLLPMRQCRGRHPLDTFPKDWGALHPPYASSRQPLRQERHWPLAGSQLLQLGLMGTHAPLERYCLLGHYIILHQLLLFKMQLVTHFVQFPQELAVRQQAGIARQLSPIFIHPGQQVFLARVQPRVVRSRVYLGLQVRQIRRLVLKSRQLAGIGAHWPLRRQVPAEQFTICGVYTGAYVVVLLVGAICCDTFWVWRLFDWGGEQGRLQLCSCWLLVSTYPSTHLVQQPPTGWKVKQLAMTGQQLPRWKQWSSPQSTLLQQLPFSRVKLSWHLLHLLSAQSKLMQGQAALGLRATQVAKTWLTSLQPGAGQGQLSDWQLTRMRVKSGMMLVEAAMKMQQQPVI